MQRYNRGSPCTKVFPGIIITSTRQKLGRNNRDAAMTIYINLIPVTCHMYHSFYITHSIYIDSRAPIGIYRNLYSSVLSIIQFPSTCCR